MSLECTEKGFELLSVEDIAERLGITPRTVHRLCRERKLAFVQVTARERRFTEAHLQAFIASRTIEPPKIVDRSASNPLPCPAKSSYRKGGPQASGESVTRIREEFARW